MAGQTTTLKQYLSTVMLSEKPKTQPAKPQQAQSQQFGVVIGSKFEESLKRHERIFPDLRDKLKKFIETKKADPLNAKYGKHDAVFKSGTPLAGYQHCHLRDDAILIYTLKNRNINLLLICSHAEFDRGQGSKIAKILAAS